MKKLIFLCATSVLLLIILNVTAYAYNNLQNLQKLNNKTSFNIKEANQQYKKIQQEFTKKDANLDELKKSVTQLEDLQDQATICVDQSEKKIKVINELLTSIQKDKSSLAKQSDYQYLKKKKDLFSKQLSDCHLFTYRTKEKLITYKDIIQKLSTSKIFERDTPIWKIHEENWLAELKTIDIKKLHAESGIKKLTNPELVASLIIIIIGALIAFYIRNLCRHWLAEHKQASSLLFALIATLSIFILPLTIFGLICGIFATIYLNVDPSPSIELVSYVLLEYIFLLAIAKYFFSPPYDTTPPIKIAKDLGKSLYRRFIILLSWILIGYLTIIIMQNQVLSPSIIELTRTIFITILSGLVVWFCWLLSDIPYFQKRSHTTVLLIKLVLSIFLIAMLAIEWFGYHNLAVYIITGILLSIFLIFTTEWVLHIINLFFHVLDSRKHYIGIQLRKISGVKPYRKLNELVIIKFVMYFIILCFFTIALLKIWNVSVIILDNIYDVLLNGFKIANLLIVPSRIILALVSFAVIFIIGRLSATAVARRHQFRREEETQIAVATIILYITFAIALLFAFLIAGVSFTGLAIIAGALSVGIGLGLQNIVNNFASGLVLLLEKPIRPGDRIVIGDTEGFVKKIRIRSTQISTLAKEDVIVPNSELVSNKVTNYMFRDRFWRVVCQVGVMYGSDVSLVRKVLLEVAANHPEVMQQEPNTPNVLFQNFGDSSLVFELWCIIRDVNKKFVVASDLHFAINQAFQQHKIIIAFPQRDVHIKEHIDIKNYDK